MDLYQNDKNLELQRYNSRARALTNSSDEVNIFGALEERQVLRAPYMYFEEQIKRFVTPESYVLEIGSGTGRYTGSALTLGAQVIASDISELSLDFLAKRYKSSKNLQLKVEDMEALSFDDNVFDVVISAGSLSYGDNWLVLQEVRRVLKSDGVFICVDSLNHNPIYKLNRWIHFFRGRRTKSTLERMPTLKTIASYGKFFSILELNFFGSLSWLMPLFKFFFGDVKSASLSDRADEMLGVRASAFKFVMVAKKVML
jgi:ubiquinone/menaquinone biosynthesis C-methylase UbiE